MPLGPGRFGQGLKLDGVDDRVYVAGLPRPAGAFSMELWANLPAGSGGLTLMDLGAGQPFLDTYNGLRTCPPCQSFGTVPTGRWTHLAYTWDTTTARFYIDGAQVGTSASAPPGPGTGVTIGSRNAGSYPTQGTLDEVAVFGRALSASEVASHTQHTLLGDRLGDACDPCPGNADPDCRPTGCTDEDGDGYGVQGASNCAAGHPEVFDCDDHNASIHSGAFDDPGTPIDNNCDGLVDGVPAAMTTTYQWDGNGNLLGDGREWDARDRLVSGGYGYDTGDLRVRMGEQKVLLDGIEEAREYGTEMKRYDHDPSRVDGLLAQKTGVGKGYFVTDALGSVYAVVDASGAVVSKYGYDVYGARTATAEGMATSWGFTGRRHDEQGEMYYRARYLNTGIGAFSQVDLLRRDEGIALLARYLRSEKRRASPGALAGLADPFSSVESLDEDPPEPPPLREPYGYAAHDPTNRTDPTGLVDCTFLPPLVRCQSRRTGEELLMAEAHTGNLGCINSWSEECQCVENVGPIPRGTYRMEPHEKYPRKYRLKPPRKLRQQILQRCPRRNPDSFLFVAASAQTQSHGCIVLHAEAVSEKQWLVFMAVAANEGRNRMVVQ